MNQFSLQSAVDVIHAMIRCRIRRPCSVCRVESERSHIPRENEERAEMLNADGLLRPAALRGPEKPRGERPGYEALEVAS